MTCAEHGEMLLEEPVDEAEEVQENVEMAEVEGPKGRMLGVKWCPKTPPTNWTWKKKIISNKNPGLGFPSRQQLKVTILQALVARRNPKKILGLTSNHHGMRPKEAWSTACPMSQFDGDVPCETVRSPNERDLVKRSRDMVTTCPHNVSKGIEKELEWADTLTHLHTSSIGQTLFEVLAVPGDPCSFALKMDRLDVLIWHIQAVTASLRSEVTESQVSSPPIPSPARAGLGLQQNLLALSLGEGKKGASFDLWFDIMHGQWARHEFFLWTEEWVSSESQQRRGTAGDVCVLKLRSWFRHQSSWDKEPRNNSMYVLCIIMYYYVLVLFFFPILILAILQFLVVNTNYASHSQ